jgi:hypothetical protein
LRSPGPTTPSPSISVMEQICRQQFHSLVNFQMGGETNLSRLGECGFSAFISTGSLTHQQHTKHFTISLLFSPFWGLFQLAQEVLLVASTCDSSYRHARFSFPILSAFSFLFWFNGLFRRRCLCCTCALDVDKDGRRWSIVSYFIKNSKPLCTRRNLSLYRTSSGRFTYHKFERRNGVWAPWVRAR